MQVASPMNVRFFCQGTTKAPPNGKSRTSNAAADGHIGGRDLIFPKGRHSKMREASCRARPVERSAVIYTPHRQSFRASLKARQPIFRELRVRITSVRKSVLRQREAPRLQFLSERHKAVSHHHQRCKVRHTTVLRPSASLQLRQKFRQG